MDWFITKWNRNAIVPSQEMPLRREYEHYLTIKSSLLPVNSGKFALIKDEELIGVFDTDADAYRAGLGRFGNVPFLIVRVQEGEEKSWIPVLQLGLLRASS